jgi:hypothetical protein
LVLRHSERGTKVKDLKRVAQRSRQAMGREEQVGQQHGRVWSPMLRWELKNSGGEEGIGEQHGGLKQDNLVVNRVGGICEGGCSHVPLTSIVQRRQKHRLAGSRTQETLVFGCVFSGAPGIEPEVHSTKSAAAPTPPRRKATNLLQFAPTNNIGNMESR